MWKQQTSQEPYDINGAHWVIVFFLTFQSNNSIEFLVQDQTKNQFPAVPIPFPPPTLFIIVQITHFEGIK